MLGLWFALSALAFALIAFEIRVNRWGMYETAAMHCPALLPEVNIVMRGLALAACVLAAAAVIFHALRGREPSGWSDPRAAALDLAVFIPAAAAVVPALIAFSPMICA